MRGCRAPMSGPSPLSSADQLLEDLNPPQREAVLHGDGPLLVLAGAGSGKTRVITRRVAHLVLARRVAPLAHPGGDLHQQGRARDARARSRRCSAPGPHDLIVATFHSAAATILRREAEKVGLTRSFVIYDDADQLQLVKRAMREERVDPRAQSAGCAPAHRRGEERRARLPDVERVSPDDYRGLAVQRAYRAYQKLLRAANAVDFGDLLLLLVELLRKRLRDAGRSTVRASSTCWWTSSRTPTRCSTSCCSGSRRRPASNLVVVGDDDQSIYRWRGAEVSNILEFPELYRGARVVKLEQNYRCDQNILDAANAVIAKNPRRMAEEALDRPPKGEPLHLLISPRRARGGARGRPADPRPPPRGLRLRTRSDGRSSTG